MKKIKLTIILATVLLGCGPKENPLKKNLLGEWRNTFLKVTMNTVGNTDKELITQCDSTEWEKMLKMKPIRTFFNVDGSYRSEYYNLKDSLFRTAKGTWLVSNDTLVMNQAEPSPASYKMRTIINDRTVFFDGMIDFDEDGKEDDHYEGRQHKQ